MGTFHDNLGELHGITVAVRLKDGRVVVGRCHEANDVHVQLLDLDIHEEGQDEISNEAWLRRAARWGVFPKHRSLKLPSDDVRSITPLGRIESV